MMAAAATTGCCSAPNVMYAAQCCLPFLGQLCCRGVDTVSIAVPRLATATQVRDSHRPWPHRIRARYSERQVTW